ncbi:MAG: prohibitin family protein [Candidatus Obscuribacter phosphatis]|uniref:Prohibitin family protein n=1 Tax=Candidatus Obscuribacter phosphatis TaxID=1906157 RepID=A0A8J7TNF1_9BACT|nr:prohibitin family protein [Candidatus Obscuribacter phosphatis]
MNIKKISLIGAAVVAVIGLAFLGRTVTWVNPGYVGVVTQFGSVEPIPIKSGDGPTIINPTKSVVQLPTSQLYHHIKAAAATAKGQSAPTEITVAYSVKDDMWPRVYATIGGAGAINAAYFDNNVMQALKAVTGNYQADDLIQKRSEVKEKVVAELQKAIDNALAEKGLRGAIIINMIAITDFDFSKEFNDSIDAKVEAEQRAQQAESEALQKATIARAQGEVQKKIADARAYETEMLSKARAEAMSLKGAALKEAGGLLDLRKAEKWDGEVPEYHKDGTIPFINIDPRKGR